MTPNKLIKLIFMKGSNLLKFNCEDTILGYSRVKNLTKDDIELLMSQAPFKFLEF